MAKKPAPKKKKGGNPFAKGGPMDKTAEKGGKKGFVPGKKGVNPFAKKK